MNTIILDVELTESMGTIRAKLYYSSQSVVHRQLPLVNTSDLATERALVTITLFGFLCTHHDPLHSTQGTKNIILSTQYAE